MRILLAIDDGNLRLSIELLISQEPSVNVVGVASEKEGLLALIESTRPDLVMLDWDLPGRSPTNLMAHMRNHLPRISFIMLGNEPTLQITALHDGADGFVLKGEPPEKLLTTFREVRFQRKRVISKSDELEE